ncbi:MAG: hypothetical protein JNM07_10650 [Phycisphaerae bacterium]|nr:hypothetical protein [Phycisphaerae bacterium]
MSVQGRKTVGCPACGYDLSGAGPHGGRVTCSECGRRWEWDAALGAASLGPWWSFEHGFGPAPQRWARTALRCLTPWRVWGGGEARDGIDPRAPSRPWRLVMFAAPILLGSHALIGGLVAWAQSSEPAWLRGSPTFVSSVLGADTAGGWRLAEAFVWPWDERFLHAARPTLMDRADLAGLALVALAGPAAWAAGRLARAREVPRGHLIRASWMSLPGAAVLLLVSMLVRLYQEHVIGAYGKGWWEVLDWVLEPLLESHALGGPWGLSGLLAAWVAGWWWAAWRAALDGRRALVAWGATLGLDAAAIGLLMWAV